MSEVAIGAAAVAGMTGQSAAEMWSAATDRQRVAKAALDFEGLLLANWLEAVEQGIRDMGGDELSAGSETMGALGMQALASGIAARGGIGLAKVLLKHLPTASEPSGAADASRAESAGSARAGDGLGKA